MEDRSKAEILSFSQTKRRLTPIFSTREELALRVGIFYSSASLSGAFGGLLASGLSHIPTTSIVDSGWRWVE